MSGFAERIQITDYASTQAARGSDWPPYRAGAQDEERRLGDRLGAFGALAAFLLFSGMPLVVAKAQAFLVNSYGISAESLLVTAWMIQGAAALLAFGLTVRWLRS